MPRLLPANLRLFRTFGGRLMTRSMEDDFVFRKFFAACRLFVLTMQLKTVSCLFTTHVCSDATNCFALIHCSSSHLSLKKKTKKWTTKVRLILVLSGPCHLFGTKLSLFFSTILFYMTLSHEFFSFANITLFVLKKQIKHNTIITYYYYNTSIRQKTIR